MALEPPRELSPHRQGIRARPVMRRILMHRSLRGRCRTPAGIRPDPASATGHPAARRFRRTQAPRRPRRCESGMPTGSRTRSLRGVARQARDAGRTPRLQPIRGFIDRNVAALDRMMPAIQRQRARELAVRRQSGWKAIDTRQSLPDGHILNGGLPISRRQPASRMAGRHEQADRIRRPRSTDPHRGRHDGSAGDAWGPRGGVCRLWPVPGAGTAAGTFCALPHRISERETP